MKAIKLESNFVRGELEGKNPQDVQLAKNQKSMKQSGRQEIEENRSSTAPSIGQSSSSVLEQRQSLGDDTGISSTSTICPAPICRQFWKAGNYNDGFGTKVTLPNGKSYLHVHPMFLHSNATSRKWAFGAIAELLDNAIDEPVNTPSRSKYQEALNLMLENKKLQSQCLEYEKRNEDFGSKVTKLRNEIEEVKREYDQLMGELKLLDLVKEEKDVDM